MQKTLPWYAPGLCGCIIQYTDTWSFPEREKHTAEFLAMGWTQEAVDYFYQHQTEEGQHTNVERVHKILVKCAQHQDYTDPDVMADELYYSFNGGRTHYGCGCIVHFHGPRDPVTAVSTGPMTPLHHPGHTKKCEHHAYLTSAAEHHAALVEDGAAIDFAKDKIASHFKVPRDSIHAKIGKGRQVLIDHKSVGLDKPEVDPLMLVLSSMAGALLASKAITQDEHAAMHKALNPYKDAPLRGTVTPEQVMAVLNV